MIARLTFCLLLLPVPVAAHDFWIEPETFEPVVGEPLAVRLFVGERFDAEPLTRLGREPVRFSALDVRGSRPVTRLGDDATGLVSASAEGLLAIGYESRPSFLELEADLFERYLHQEGLERVVLERERRGEGERPGRELFSRSAKCLVRTGRGPTAARSAAPLGLPLELVPEQDPYSLAAGDRLTVRLEHRGRPLADALVVAIPKSDPSRARRGRTGGDGRLVLTLDSPGPWLVKAVHMEAASDEAPEAADWRSWWASLTFAIPGG